MKWNYILKTFKFTIISFNFYLFYFPERPRSPWEVHAEPSGLRGAQVGNLCPRRNSLTYLLTYSMEQSPSWEANRFSASQEIPTFYGTRKVITTFTSACHLSLSQATSIQSISLHLTSWRSILILSSHLHLGLTNGLFPSGFPTKTPYAPLLSPIRATCPAHLILLNLITRKILGDVYRSLSSSLCSFLHPPPLPRPS